MHIKDNVVAFGTCPTTELLSALSESVCQNKYTASIENADLHAPLGAGRDDSACMLPRELIWKGVAPPVCSQGFDPWRGWLHLYAPQEVDLGGDGLSCMLPRGFIRDLGGGLHFYAPRELIWKG